MLRRLYILGGVMDNKANLANPKEFRNGKYIEKGDLVLVHRTDYFPENGAIKTRLYSNPEILRDTVHFCLNGPVSSHEYGNWDDKKYTLLVPLDRLSDETLNKMQNINPADTFFLGDFELPEGSVILGAYEHTKGRERQSGKAKIKEIDSEGSEEAIYGEIKNMGYHPMKVDKWNWSSWNCGDCEVLNDSAKHWGLNAAHRKHDGHWTQIVENASRTYGLTEADIYSNAQAYVKKVMDVCDEKVKSGIVFYENFIAKELERGVEVDTDMLKILQHYKNEYDAFLREREQLAGKLHHSIIRYRAKKAVENLPEMLAKRNHDIAY